MSYFCFSIYKAIRKVLFLGIFDQRSYKGLISNATEFFQILDKFFFKEISKLSRMSILILSAFQLFDNTLCEKTKCLDSTHSNAYYGHNCEGTRS